MAFTTAIGPSHQPRSPSSPRSGPRRPHRPHRRGGLRALLVLTALGLALIGCHPVETTGTTQTTLHQPIASTLHRPLDPVVVTGASLPQLQAVRAIDIVGFRWVEHDGWGQLPVQVDERLDADIGTIYHFGANGVIVNVYADATTWTGPDPDPTFDPDDELAFMARDAGGEAPERTEPQGVVAGTGVDLRVTDPAAGERVGHVYLFERDDRPGGVLDPAAGKRYLSYGFELKSGDYKTTYRNFEGPNPEDSTITTPFYQRHFTDRWAEDRLRITTPGSTGVDVLDRHKVRFAPGLCVRSEDTFDAAEGAFVTNRSGSVRAIRSYIGANSGPNTMRTHVFYDQREDVVTDLRVHQIPGVMDFYDYSPEATGMTYANPLNPEGVVIDGIPDEVFAATPVWQKVDGRQGAMVISSRLDTDTGVSYTSWYEDNKANPTQQCTGDTAAYGSSGPWVNTTIPCTDPGLGCDNHLRATQVLSYLAPGLSADAAAARATQGATPLDVVGTRWPRSP